MKQSFFAKSFEDDFILKTVKNKKKVPSQSIANIIKTKSIKPNTNSFGRNKRLACTYLSKNYSKTYRAQGLIFQTKENPKHIYPFDLAVLTKNNNIIVNYYRIENNLHIYYNHRLIDGFEKFLFNDFESMIKKIPSPEIALERVNELRLKSGFNKLTKQKMKLLKYNEIVFERTIKVKPIAIFGYKKITREIAKKYNLPHYISTKKFVEKMF